MNPRHAGMLHPLVALAERCSAAPPTTAAGAGRGIRWLAVDAHGSRIDPPADAAPQRLPEDPRLAKIAAELDRVRIAAELFDADWRMAWISDELKTLIGERDEVKIGYGAHVLEARANELWSSAATEEA